MDHKKAARAALQHFEEIGGPEGDDYLKVMEAVIADATERIKNFKEIEAPMNNLAKFEKLLENANVAFDWDFLEKDFGLKYVVEDDTDGYWDRELQDNVLGPAFSLRVPTEEYGIFCFGPSQIKAAKYVECSTYGDYWDIKDDEGNDHSLQFAKQTMKRL